MIQAMESWYTSGVQHMYTMHPAGPLGQVTESTLLIITPKGRGPLGASVSLRTMYTCTCFGTLCRDSGLALVESADFLDY